MNDHRYIVQVNCNILKACTTVNEATMKYIMVVLHPLKGYEQFVHFFRNLRLDEPLNAVLERNRGNFSQRLVQMIEEVIKACKRWESNRAKNSNTEKRRCWEFLFSLFRSTATITKKAIFSRSWWAERKINGRGTTKKTRSAKVSYIVLELERLRSVPECAERLRSSGKKIDILILNAGVAVRKTLSAFYHLSLT